MSIKANELQVRWTADAVRKAVVDAVTKIQDLGGNPTPVFADDLLILGGIEKFDSLTGVELLTMLSTEFQVELPDDVLHDADTQKPLTLAQFVEKLAEFLNGADTAAPEDER